MLHGARAFREALAEKLALARVAARRASRGCPGVEIVDAPQLSIGGLPRAPAAGRAARRLERAQRGLAGRDQRARARAGSRARCSTPRRGRPSRCAPACSASAPTRDRIDALLADAAARAAGRNGAARVTPPTPTVQIARSNGIGWRWAGRGPARWRRCCATFVEIESPSDDAGAVARVRRSASAASCSAIGPRGRAGAGRGGGPVLRARERRRAARHAAGPPRHGLAAGHAGRAAGRGSTATCCADRAATT